jgi:hypothetical protein
MRLNLVVHTGDPHRISVLEGTPQGALPTEGIVDLGGRLMISGLAPALRKLAAALGEAAAQAELFDADPDAYREAERARRERDHGLGEEAPDAAD